MTKPKPTSVTYCLVSSSRERLTRMAQPTTRTLMEAVSTSWARRKRAHSAARVAWPEGKE